eukprot:TRINITY_DN1091_c0_g1_i3.p1 TRINITY_DN1091_c0_g1~~TRINITY_DN1091_c0_g1_i3.p1  ORF type:complete len:540 (-),score=189.18 TRINITY_DN1091_c0_g1_i3:277-1896(-)
MVMNITDIDDKIIMRANEQNIPFTDLSRKWEQSFMEDMKDLKVQAPDVLTRVSEYVPEIVSYIEQIVKNGFAYDSNGSVYFDVNAFNKKHHYAKLQPWSVGDAKLAAEGEGALSSESLGAADKRSPFDFALWKKSKPGEPKWNSPWGEGRPGWHIECSAMASDILGDSMDVHSGGEDLRFPHHDNELAQSEAYHQCNQWVNYFIHSGHLHINGCKMSKSLKNFVTIRQALDKYNPRQMRMLFLMHKYDGIMDYSDVGMMHAIEADKLFSEFFHSIKGILRKHKLDEVEKWGNNEKELNNTLIQAKQSVHKALSDNFNTPEVIKILSQLVNKTNVYISNEKTPKAYLLRAVANYLTYLFKIFGLIDTSDIGYTTSEANVEATLGPVLDVFTDFRAKVRDAAKKKDVSKLLELSDYVRDDALPPLGIRFSDLPDGSALWKLDDPQTLMQEVAQKRQIEEQKRLAKEARLKEEQEKLEKAKITPEDMFRDVAQYSKWNEQGVPTHDLAGEPLSKSAQKKIQQAFDKQKKAHEQWKKSQNAQQ